ncbi:diacylglycerol/polyprenol kinase family protein [Leptospira sarikeiensis]|uniref:Dolichol kinase n=1 Tax=Leptospira sarikeiensis TaxID=2484943 RepID=A0A4R9K7Q3_9LEPT|nr:dolichol kinase [Leptospira sarikeiensis]TGL62359.1 dolichol kinase [Leptospira sarikeiensis]
MKSEKTTSFNYFRKAWHLLGLIIPAFYYFDVFHSQFLLVYATRAILTVLLLICLALLVLLEWARFKIPAVQNLFVKFAGPLLKEEEKYRINGTFPYFLSITLVVFFFPPDIAILSLLFLVIGDPMAAWVGTHFGKNRFSNGKSKEGIVAFILSSAIVGLWFIYVVQSDTREFGIYRFAEATFWQNILLVLPAVIAAAVTELYSGTYLNGIVDDNLLIPVVSAIVLGLFAYFILDLSIDQIFLDPTQIFEMY